MFQLIIKLVNYLKFILTFPFDWEPTDGDHLNFSLRIHNSDPIYLNPDYGQLLSVYNPLYHLIIEIIGKGNQDFILARKISLFFFILLLMVLSHYIYKKSGYILSFLASLLILFSPIPGLTLDFIQISPSSLMALTFLLTGVTFEKLQFQKNKLPLIFVTSLLSLLCFFSKQQGFISIVVILLMLVKNQLLRKYSFLYVIIISISIIGISNFFNSNLSEGYDFLASTIYDVHRYVVTYWKLGVIRILMFLYWIFFFMLAVLFIIYRKHKNKTELNFWEVSVLSHLPFVFFLVRNGGGGANYFATLWISVIIVFLSNVKNIISGLREIQIIDSLFSKNKIIKIISICMFLTMFIHTFSTV